MSGNKTEERIAKLEREKEANNGSAKIETEGEYIKKTKAKEHEESSTEAKPSQRSEPVHAGPLKIMGAGVPYLAAGIVWFVFAMVVPIYKLWNILWVSAVAWGVFKMLTIIRNRKIAKQPPEHEEKIFTDDIAGKINILKDMIIDRATMIHNPEVRENLGSVATTLSKMAEEVENDPKDGQKVRKLANYYGDMFLGLVDKYINYEKNADVVPEGVNITQGMERIEEAIVGVDKSLKKLLDSLFSMDNLETNAEISTLDSLMQLDLGKKATELTANSYLDENFSENTIEKVISEGLNEKEN